MAEIVTVYCGLQVDLGFKSTSRFFVQNSVFDL